VIPTFDLSALDAASLRRACEDVGFFTVVGHGVPPELIDEVAARSRAFFDRPAAEKEAFRAPAETAGLPVYRPLGAEKLGASADRKASLDWGPGLVGVGGRTSSSVRHMRATTPRCSASPACSSTRSGSTSRSTSTTCPPRCA